MFDPLDLTELEVRLGGRTVGIGGAAARSAGTFTPKPGPSPIVERPAATGIDYLGLVAARRERELQQRIDYRNLPPAGGENDEETTQ